MKMKIYKLQRKPDRVKYDNFTEFVVRAPDARTARKLARQHEQEYHHSPYDNFSAEWLQSAFTTCRQLRLTGPPEVLSTEYLNG